MKNHIKTYLIFLLTLLFINSGFSQEQNKFSYNNYFYFTICQTDSLYDAGNYQGSLQYLLQKMDTMKEPRYYGYQVAQNYALLGKPDSAYYYLFQFMDVSGDDRAIYIEQDFEILRKDKIQWKKVTDRIEEKYLSELSPSQNKVLAVELFKLGIYDQYYRGGYGIIARRRPDPNRKEMDFDKQNMAQLKKIIRQNGFPTISMVGKCASNNAFLILQHNSIKKKYYKIFADAYQKGDVSSIAYALLTDRYRLQNKKKQLYGSQSVKRLKNGEWEKQATLLPVEDFKNINQRRKEIGYNSTIEEYCKENNIRIPEEYYK